MSDVMFKSNEIIKKHTAPKVISFMCKIPSSRGKRKIKLGVSIHVHFRRDIGKF